MKFWLFFFIALIFTSCASNQFLQQKDYRTSRYMLNKRSPQKALRAFPTKERGEFITSMEQAYLNLLRGKAKIAGLQKYAKIAEKRLRFKASRELKTFFFLETPEGYYASEHEIVLLHIFLSWGYSLKKQYSKAQVEAKIASNLLSNHWSEEGRFDDAWLRILLGYIWALCGRWQDARVDFRVAHSLQPKYRWLQQLANLEKQPDYMLLVLSGTGPEPHWDPKVKWNPLRGLRSLKFSYYGKKSSMTLDNRQGQRLILNRSPDAKNWYRRHITRDHEIHDLIEDSNYGQLVFANVAKATTISVAGFVGGLGVMTLGLGVGGGLIYLGVEYSIDELMAIGVVVIVAGFSKGAEIMEDAFDYSVDDASHNLDVARKYRYVRFLPEYGYVGWQRDGIFSFPAGLYVRRRKVLTLRNQHQKKMQIIYYPDVR